MSRTLTAASSFVTDVVRVTLAVRAGTEEDLAPYKGSARAHWWLRGSRLDAQPYVELLPGTATPTRGPSGKEPFSAEVSLVQNGKYTLGCGERTRLTFQAPCVPCTVVLDVRDGSMELRPVGAVPTLSVVPDVAPTMAELDTDEDDTTGEHSDPHHIFGIPAFETITFPTGQAAFERFTDLGRDRAYTYADVQAGKVGVRKGQAPRKVAQPVPPPMAATPESGALDHVRALLRTGKGSGQTLTEAAQAHHDAAWSEPDMLGGTGDGVTSDDDAPDGDYGTDEETPIERAWKGFTGVVGQAIVGQPVTPTPPPPPVRQLAGQPMTVAPVVVPASAFVVQGPAPSQPVPVPSKPDVRPAAPSYTWDGGEMVVSAEAVARIKADNDHLSKLGIALPPPVVELGGRVVQLGRDNLVKSHADWASHPRMLDALEHLRATVAAEKRQDISAPRACDITMREDGSLHHPNWGAMALRPEPAALKDLISEHRSVLPAAGQTLMIVDPDVRATVWNRQVPKSLATRHSVLRTRLGADGQRSIYASVSPGYTSLDADQLASLIGDALGRTAGGDQCRGEVSYNPNNTTVRMTGIWHADNVSNFSAGDIFQAGWTASTNDGGGGAIYLGPSLWRNGCYNLIVIFQSTGGGVRIVHRGDRASMVRQITQGMDKVRAAVGPFLKRWGYLRTQPLASLLVNPSAETEVNVRAVMAAIARPKGDKVEASPDLPTLVKGALPSGLDNIEGIERDSIVEAMLRGWQDEPGDSIADIINGVTRVHTQKVPIPVLRQLEERAGELVMSLGQV